MNTPVTAPPTEPAATSAVPRYTEQRGITTRVVYYSTRWLTNLLFRVRVHNLEHLPRTGPVLILPTHCSYLDPIIVGSHVPRHVFFLARENLLRVPLLGHILRSVNTQPIRRGAGDREALRLCRAALNAGWPLIFFPEGTRSRDGRLGPLQGGFVMLLEGLDVPYVPVNVQDTFAALPRGAVWPRLARVEMTVGAPRRLPPREPGEKSRAYVDRCVAQLEADLRAIGAR